MMMLRRARKLLWISAVISGVAICALPAFAGEVARVKIGSFSKRAYGTLRSASAGDVACYLSMKDDRGVAFDEMADFDLCAPESVRRFKGNRVALTYEIASVLSAECDGNMDCGKHDRVALVKTMRIAPLRRK